MGVLIFGEVGRKVQVLVSVRLLPVHCRSSFLVNFTSKNGMLLFSVFPCENYATCGVYSVHVSL